MSLDLLAAFEDLSQNQNATPDKQTLAANEPQPAQHDGLSSGQDDAGLDEEFGDFEDAAVSSPPVRQHAPPAAAAVSPLVQKRAELNRQDTEDWFSNVGKPTAASKQQPSSRLPFTTKPIQPSKDDSRIGRHPFADHMDVLFAADDSEYSAGQDEWHDLSNNPEAAMAYSKRIIEEQIAAQSQQNPQQPKQLTTEPTITRTASPAEKPQQSSTDLEPAFKPRNLDVLFDADDLSDDARDGGHDDDDDAGDWGDFEETQPVATLAAKAAPASAGLGARRGNVPPSITVEQSASRTESASASFDLLGLNSAPTPVTPDMSKNLEPRQALARSPASFNRIITQGFAIDGGWDDFDAPVAATTSSSSEVQVTTSQTDARRPSMPKIPPSNIPPPSVLLSVFPETLKQPIQQKDVSDRIAAANVLAHILAGRKLRWKRCSALAASMRIGPAAAGGKGGMKLTGLDRTETVKEDREVAEVLAAWRAQLGRLRSAYATFTSANSATGRLLQAKLPEVSDPAPVKTLKAPEGGFTAPHECALCGLKRQERVVHVDDNVEDSFGEWWAEGVDMHTFCLTWWTDHEAALRSR